MSKLSKEIIVSTSTHGLLTLKYSSKYQQHMPHPLYYSANFFE